MGAQTKILLDIFGGSVEFGDVDHKGRKYREFFADRSGVGPGWYVYGRCRDAYGPQGVIRICARPDVPARTHQHYNPKVRRGWHLLREARAVADELNRRYPADVAAAESDPMAEESAAYAPGMGG